MTPDELREAVARAIYNAWRKHCGIEQDTDDWEGAGMQARAINLREADAAIATIRAALREQAEEAAAANAALAAERDAAQAKAARLREALEKIAGMDAVPYVSGGQHDADFCEGYDMAAGSAADYARAVLAKDQAAREGGG